MKKVTSKDNDGIGYLTQYLKRGAGAEDTNQGTSHYGGFEGRSLSALNS